MSQKIIEALVEATKEDPQEPFPYFALAKEYEKLNDTKATRRHYQHLIDHFPSYSGTYYHYALFLIENNNMEMAHNIIEQGLTMLKRTGESKLYNELYSLKESYFNE